MSGLPRWLGGKESSCRCRRHRRCMFDSLVGKIPWSRKWQPAPVFLPRKFHGQEEPGRLQSVGSQSWTWLSTHTHTIIVKSWQVWKQSRLASKSLSESKGSLQAQFFLGESWNVKAFSWLDEAHHTMQVSCLPQSLLISTWISSEK